MATVNEEFKTKTPGAGALQVLAQGRTAVMALSPARRGVLAAAALGVLAIGAAAWWWTSRVDWKPLYSGLEARDAAQVEGELAAASIPYQASADGSGIDVPAEMVDKARMTVATKGAPASGRMGFELFDKPNWMGSDFDERVNYQRALEGELEHTIGTLGAVRSARVHLVLPKDSMFAGEREAAKASVVLRLRQASLGRDQIAAIRALVAGAVEGLSQDDVTLVDADGRTDMTAGAAHAAEGDEESAMERKLVSMLEPLAGTGNVRATVNLTRDQNAMDRVDEIVDPTQSAPLTTERREERTGDGTADAATNRAATGVPGTASNTVAAVPAGSVAAQARPSLPVFPNGAAGQSQARQEQSTFAVTRHTVHTESVAGRVTRVSAAVVVNDRESPAAAGDKRTVWKSRSADEMRRFTELAQAAVGFDAARGDKIAVENIAFEDNTSATTPTRWSAAQQGAMDLLRAQPGLLKTVGGLLLAAMLLVMVARPVGTSVSAMLREQAALPSPAGLSMLGDGKVPAVAAGVAAALPGSQPAAITAAQRLAPPTTEVPRRAVGSSIDNEGVLEYVTDQLRRSPVQGTQLLGAWINARDEARA